MLVWGVFLVCGVQRLSNPGDSFPTSQAFQGGATLINHRDPTHTAQRKNPTPTTLQSSVFRYMCFSSKSRIRSNEILKFMSENPASCVPLNDIYFELGLFAFFTNLWEIHASTSLNWVQYMKPLPPTSEFLNPIGSSEQLQAGHLDTNIS